MGADISAAAKQVQDQHNTVDIARAEAEKTQGFLGIKNSFANDPNYDTYNKRAPVQTNEVVKNAGNLIRDPRMRERWLIGAGTDALRLNDGINDHGVTMQREAETVAFDNALETNRRIYVDPNTPLAAKDKARADIEGAIKAGQASGLLDPSSADARRKTYLDQADVNRGLLAVETHPELVRPSKGNVADRIVAIESGGSNTAANDKSSASGVGQFLDSTWVETVRQHRPDIASGKSAAEIIALKTDQTLGREMTQALTQDNAEYLANRRLPPTPGNLYLAHFLGAGGATQVLKADPNASIESVVGADVVRANPFLAGKTVADTVAWSDKKMGGATQPGPVIRDLPIVFGNTTGRVSAVPDMAGVHPEVIGRFKSLQNAFGSSIPVVSGYRDPVRNERAGGAKASQHLEGNALDLDVSKMSQEDRIRLIQTARAQGFGGIGVYGNSIHIDTGPVRAWGASHHSDSIPAWARDAVNTPVGAGAPAQDMPDWYKRLSPEDQFRVQKRAETVQNQQAVEQKGYLDVAVTNAPAAILNTGTYSGPVPNADQFFQAYGPQEGASRYNNFIASMQTSKQAYDMKTMSAGDIQTMVNAAKPTSSGNDAALQTARYQTLAQAAETTLKAREADPATYVRNAFPAVNQQWSNAASQGNYQGAVAASIAAQEQIGIKNVQPLPKEIATNAVSVFKDENQQQASRIGAVSSIIMATNDPVQRGKLFEQMVSEGLPDLTQGAFEALSRGDQGAANRLFQAAMTDPTKLAGQAKDGQKPSDIDQAVQVTLMDQGQIGDIYYGLSNGTAENYTRAQRDSKLINNAVNLRLRNGETMDAAIAGVSKDLYGDVKVVNDTNMQILVPKDQDPAAVQAGLTAQLPNVETALKTALAVPADAKVADGSKAIMTATTDNYIRDTLSQGYFRNSGDGYVFIDPKTALAVADQNGQAIIFKPDLKPVAPAAALDRNPPANIGIRDAVMGQ